MILNIQLACAIELRQLLRATDTDQSCAVLSFHQTYFDFQQRKQKIDALHQQMGQMSDQEKLSFYFISSQTLANESPQQALEYTQAGFVLAKRLSNEAQQLYFSMLELEILLEQQPREKTLREQERLTQLKTVLDALPWSYDKGMIYLIYVRINEHLENRYEQLSALHASVNMLESVGQDEITACGNQLLGLLYNELGNYYSAMKHGKKSRDYHRMALTAFQQNKDLSRVGVAKFNLGLIAYREHKYEEAIDYFNQVITLKQQLKEDFGMALSHMHMGAIYNKIDHPEEALKHLQLAIPLLETRQANNRLALGYSYLGETYHRLQQPNQADESILKSVDLAEKHLPPISSLQIYQDALTYLSPDTHEEKKNQIRTLLLNAQSTVLDSIEQDVSARSEAEILLNQQKSQNKLLAHMTGVQKHNLVLQQSINAEQKKWIIILSIVIIALLWSVIRQIRANREKTRLANTDYLTGLKNRRSFYDDLHQVHAAAKEGEIRNFLLIMDIDHFKQINDTFGHSMGDVVLTELSKLISNSYDNCGCFFRIGGEEFAFICEFENEQEARFFAERIRNSVEQHDWTFGQIALNVTISIGLSAIDKSQTISDVVKRADRALYWAKERGRNKVEMWRPKAPQMTMWL